MPSAIFETSVSITGMRGLGSVNCTGRTVVSGDPLSIAAFIVVGGTVRSGAKGTNAVVVVVRIRGAIVVVVVVVVVGNVVVVVVVVGNVVVVVDTDSAEPPPP
jgi:hypothetical protein